MNVNAKFPGSIHDAHIWRESNVSVIMEQVYRQNNNNIFYLLGDSGYPLRPWLLTPIREEHLDDRQQRFNDAFASIRSLIERCNGVLKNRFRCLLKDRVLHYSPQKASKIINSCVVLHNMCLHFNIPEPDPEDVDDFGLDENLYGDVPDPPHAPVNPDLARARQIQQNLVNNYFR